jgi:AcrR family transcriptional regulator
MPSGENTISTEEKIKTAARTVFMRKGYAAARTRDIAEECGLNLALINYYFRSKENLFNIVMLELCQQFASSVKELLNNPETTLHEKIEKLVHHYIDLLLSTPSIPLFILNEAHTNPDMFLSRIGMNDTVEELYIVKQWKEMAEKARLTVNPLHIILNTISMTVFPFATAPMVMVKSKITIEAYKKMMEDRKTMIPKWIALMLEHQHQ